MKAGLKPRHYNALTESRPFRAASQPAGLKPRHYNTHYNALTESRPFRAASQPAGLKPAITCRTRGRRFDQLSGPTEGGEQTAKTKGLNRVDL